VIDDQGKELSPTTMPNFLPLSCTSMPLPPALKSNFPPFPVLIVVCFPLQVLNYSTDTFMELAGLQQEQAKFATMGIGAIMVGMTLISIMLMDRAGRRTLHLYGLGGMFVFSLFITIAMLIKVIDPRTYFSPFPVPN